MAFDSEGVNGSQSAFLNEAAVDMELKTYMARPATGREPVVAF
jgi:hypothetical protein